MPYNNIATLDPSRQLKPVVYRKPGEESKGGEYHGGPRRWTGKGPPPARHIPWPEIFKHHISVIEGHKKMIDMVRKHTVSGTGNWRTITDMFNRTEEMLKTSKQLSYTFIPPPNQRDRVPLGVSSDSMYPGYSPADHEYGKAAEEYGKAVAEAKARGVDIPKHPDIDYQIGQGKGTKRKNLAQMREMKQGSNGNDDDATAMEPNNVNGNATPSEVKVEENKAQTVDSAAEGNDNPVFVIDTNPTPVKIPHHLLSPSKRGAESGGDEMEPKKSKKSKTKHSGDLPTADNKVAETEDITAEVDARIKSREERRKAKEEKKRKRESEKSDGAAPAEEVAEPANATVPAVEGEGKPRKKKSKVKHVGEGEEGGSQKGEKKRGSEDEEEEGGKKKKSKVKHAGDGEEQVSQKAEKKRAGAGEEDGDEGEKKRNKRRRKD